MKSDFVTKLIFSDSVQVELSNDQDNAMISISHMDSNKDPDEFAVTMKADEVELLISALTLYKNRLKEWK